MMKKKTIGAVGAAAVAFALAAGVTFAQTATPTTSPTPTTSQMTPSGAPNTGFAPQN
jgi:hypothetical protein